MEIDLASSIKPSQLENILFHGESMTLKLADFGICLNLREERSVTRAGTLDYMVRGGVVCLKRLLKRLP